MIIKIYFNWILKGRLAVKGFLQVSKRKKKTYLESWKTNKRQKASLFTSVLEKLFGEEIEEKKCKLEAKRSIKAGSDNQHQFSHVFKEITP